MRRFGGEFLHRLSSELKSSQAPDKLTGDFRKVSKLFETLQCVSGRFKELQFVLDRFRTIQGVTIAKTQLSLKFFGNEIRSFLQILRVHQPSYLLTTGGH